MLTGEILLTVATDTTKSQTAAAYRKSMLAGLSLKSARLMSRQVFSFNTFFWIFIEKL